MYKNTREETIQKLISEAFNKQSQQKQPKETISEIKMNKEDYIIFLQEKLAIAEEFIKRFGQLISLWKNYEDMIIVDENNLNSEIEELIIIAREILTQKLIDEYGDCVICLMIDECENVNF